jgi:hypothetical protein
VAAVSYCQILISSAVLTETKPMAGPTIAELDARIAAVRQNIRDLVEQGAALSGAADESRIADRIAQQEEELARLRKLRDERSKGP